MKRATNMPATINRRILVTKPCFFCVVRWVRDCCPDNRSLFELSSLEDRLPELRSPACRLLDCDLADWRSLVWRLLDCDLADWRSLVWRLLDLLLVLLLDLLLVLLLDLLLLVWRLLVGVLVDWRSPVWRSPAWRSLVCDLDV